MLKKSALFGVALLVIGCGSKKKSTESATGDAPKSGAVEAPKDDAPKAEVAKAPAGPLRLEKLDNLQIELAGALSVTEGATGVMIIGDNPLAVKEAGDFDPETLAEAKEEALSDSAKDLKEETLADGWALTYMNTGSLGDNYWVQVRRKIGPKTYVCSVTAAKPSQQEAALAGCKSLKL